MSSTTPNSDPRHDAHRIVVLVGNPRPRSRTASAARATAAALVATLDDASADTSPSECGPAGGDSPGAAITEVELIDLALLGAELLDESSDAVQTVVATVSSASVLVVATPTYKGTYTGLLKVLLDHLPGRALDGTRAAVVTVSKAPEHRLGAAAALEPVLVELGATVPAPALTLVEDDLDRVDEVALSWAVHHGDRFGPVTDAQAPAGAAR
ncbi:MAG TPA: NADPH-dependent FMN reductase [Jiangellaceae bacterium]